MHLTPLSASGLITMSMGMAFFKPSGGAAFEELGIVEPLEINPEFEDIEMFDPRGGVRVSAAKDTTKTTVTLTATLKMMTNRVRALSMAAAVGYQEQTAVTAGSFTVPNVEVGGIYNVGKLSLSNTSATDGLSTPVTYTLGTHYELDDNAGLVRIIAKPGGAGSNFVMTHDAAAITAAAKQLRIGIASSPNLQGAFIFRGTNQIGVKSLIYLPILQMRPSGARPLVTEEYTQTEVTGTVLFDPTQAAGEEMGYEATL